MSSFFPIMIHTVVARFLFIIIGIIRLKTIINKQNPK